MSASDLIVYVLILPVCAGLIIGGIAVIIKDQSRKRRGEPRPHEIAAAQRAQRIEQERALVAKYQGEFANPKRPTPPRR